MLLHKNIIYQLHFTMKYLKLSLNTIFPTKNNFYEFPAHGIFLKVYLYLIKSYMRYDLA